jgi:hypothetical protein
MAAAAMFFIASPPAEAVDPPIAIGEVSPPPANTGIDAASLRDVADAEIRQIDASRIPIDARRRAVVVSFALTKAMVEGPIDCTINAMLRDRKTGAMIAIIEAGAHAEGPASAELKRAVANAAVRSAVRRIPTALGAK